MDIEGPTGTKTPPEHPAYGVELTEEALSGIIHSCIPKAISRQVRVEKLHHSKSWNNRIYFIGFLGDQPSQGHVLKLAGRPFTQAKIENEVVGLSLLAHYCPMIAAPRVVAWSLDGTLVHKGRATTDTFATAVNPGVELKSPGWILMTRLGGKALDPTQLGHGDRESIAAEFADIVSTYRAAIPRSIECGNLHLPPMERLNAAHRERRNHEQDGPYFDVNGILEVESHSSEPITSITHYWQHRLSCVVNTLATENIYKPNRENGRLGRLHHFISSDLPKLLLPFAGVSHNQSAQFVFSHMDLSPRNVLVDGFPPRVSGIVDFEYSGFFPALQELMGKSIISVEEDEEGWPLDMHSVILRRLATSRVDSTLHGRTFDGDEWKLIKTLMELGNYIAPWWLSEQMSDQELISELQQARDMVDSCLSRLEGEV